MYDTQSEHKAAKILESSLFELWTRWFVCSPSGDGICPREERRKSFRVTVNDLRVCNVATVLWKFMITTREDSAKTATIKFSRNPVTTWL